METENETTKRQSAAAETGVSASLSISSVIPSASAKTDHKAAVFALADGITEEMESEAETPVSAAAD